MSDDDHKRSKRKSQEDEGSAYHKARKAWRDYAVPQISDWREKCVALLLQEHANSDLFNKEGKLIAWPSQQGMADILGAGLRTVGRSINKLKSSGLVVVKPRRRGPSKYELVIVPQPLDLNVINFDEHHKVGQHVDRSKKSVIPARSASMLTDLKSAQARPHQHSSSATSALKLGQQYVADDKEIDKELDRRAAQVARLLEGATFAALPEEQASVLQAVIVDHFNERLPPWLRRSGDGFEVAMLTESQLLLALAYEHGRAADFPVTYQSFEDDVGALEMLLAANEGTHKVVAARLARKTRAEARRELFNLSDLDPAPELSEAECEAVERVASLCGVDVATQLLVQFCLIK